jgi:hypothetical protein
MKNVAKAASSGGGFLDFLNDLPIDIAIPGAGAITGLLSSLFGSGERNEALEKALAELTGMMPELSKGAYSKDELMQHGQDIRKNLAGSGDIAATRAATSISEGSAAAGVPEGQGRNSMYVSEVAPIKAQGIQMGEQGFMNILSMIETMDSKSKNRALQAMLGKIQATGGLDDMNSFGRATAGALQGADLGMDFLGNYGKYKRDKNYEQPTFV